jgi:hypothetical protein
MGLMFRRRRPVMRLAAHVPGARRGEAASAEASQPNQYAPPPPDIDPAPDDDIDELEKLVRLHKSGQLSDKEFKTAKARLLGR